MPARKPPASKRSRIVQSGEFRFKIKAYSPETIPMARLAEYMAQLAAMLGEAKSVHFSRLEEGSTVVVHRVEREAIPKVQERALSVHRGDAPRDAVTAYKTINKLLREDNGTAVLAAKKRGATILTFPGVEESAEQFPSVKQHGHVDGFVMRVGGTDETIPVLLETEGHQVAGCYTNREIAKRLAQRLFEPARLFGKGLWARDTDGIWTLKSFKIESFEWLDRASLSEALAALRAIPSELTDEAFDELDEIRKGRN